MRCTRNLPEVHRSVDSAFHPPWIPAFRLGNNNMWRCSMWTRSPSQTAAWRWACIHLMNRVNAHNGCCYDDSTINIDCGIIIRLHLATAAMRPIDTDGVGGLSVCLLITFVSPTKRLKWSRCWLKADRGWTQGTIPLQEGGCPARWKAMGVSAAVYAAIKGIIQSSITACSERGHSILCNNSTICDAVFRQNSLTACYYCYNAWSLNLSPPFNLYRVYRSSLLTTFSNPICQWLYPAYQINQIMRLEATYAWALRLRLLC